MNFIEKSAVAAAVTISERLALIASSVPCVSAFKITPITFLVSLPITSVLESSMASSSRSLPLRTIKSPAFNTFLKPEISTGSEGYALLTDLPFVSVIDLILETCPPAQTSSPTWSVPFFTIA